MGLLLADAGDRDDARAATADQQVNETPAQVAAPAASNRARRQSRRSVEPTGLRRRTPVAPWVNLTDMVVSIYAKDAQGEYTRLVKQFIATAARRHAPPSNVMNCTPTPLFREIRLLGAARRKYRDCTCFIRRSSGAGMQGMNGSYNNLGRAGSHGCIRLTPEEAKWVFDHCPAGTLVDIYHGEANPDLTQSLLPPPSIDGKYPASMPPKVREKRVQPVKIGEYEK